MREGQQVQPGWATHYKFVKFGGAFSEHRIPKQHISTWRDLKQELSDHVGIEPNLINIAVDNRLVFFQPDTLLEDIDIKRDDICLVMAKKAQEDAFLANQLEEQKQKNMKEIEKKLNDPYSKKAYQEMKQSREKQDLYKDIVKQYSKRECLIALKECSRLDEVNSYLKEGKAKSFIERMQKDKIDKIVGLYDQQVRKELEQDKSPQNYGNIMKGLNEQFQDFNKLELNHQKYLHGKLLGRELVPPRDIKLEKEIASAVEQSNRQKKRYQNAINSLNRFPEQSRLNRSLPSLHQLNRHARLNLILQFFSHPSFGLILPKLNGDRQKCTQFLQYIQQKYASHKQLLGLIEEYKEQVIKVLSEGQPTVKEEDYYSFYQFSQGLTRCGFSKTEAITLAKASQNSLSKLKLFLEAGGIIKTFNFFAQDFILNFFNNNKSTLERIRNQQAYSAWKSQIASINPQLFSMIMRSQKFVDELRRNRQE